MTYQIKWRSVAISAFQSTGQSFDTQGTAYGTERKPAEGCGVLLGKGGSEGVKPGEVALCGLSKDDDPEHERV